MSDATSIAAPAAAGACIGILTTVFQSQRAGVAVGLVFLVVGFLILLRVREQMASDL